MCNVKCIPYNVNNINYTTIIIIIYHLYTTFLQLYTVLQTNYVSRLRNVWCIRVLQLCSVDLPVYTDAQPATDNQQVASYDHSLLLIFLNSLSRFNLADTTSLQPNITFLVDLSRFQLTKCDNF